MKLNREVRIGLLVVAVFVVLIWGLNFLKGRDILSSADRYYGVYKRVDGLTNASPIYYKGFKIGTVRDINIYSNDKVNFIVTFYINKNVKFPENTLAQIYSLDLMGSKGVQFIEGDSKTYLNPGDTLNAAVMGDFVDQMSMQVLPLKEKTEKLIVKLDSTLARLSGFFNEDNIKHFSNIMQNVSNTTKDFAEISNSLKIQLEDGGNISNSLSQIDSIATAMGSAKENIAVTFENIAEFSESLKEADFSSTVGALNSSLSQVDSLMMTVNEGQGSLGMLLHDKELYYRLTDASSSLDRLLVDVRHNPKRYVSLSAFDFGKKVYKQDNGLGKDGIVFMVLIEESRKPLKLAGKIIETDLRIYEDYDGSTYLYTMGQVNSYNEAQNILEKVKPHYSKAKIVAFEHGESVRLKKAINKSEK